MEFLRLACREEIYKTYFHLFKPLGSKQVSVFEAYKHFASKDVYATENIPYFPRSSVDGFAVKASNTVGATPSSPVLLRFVGEVSMAERPKLTISTGETCRIWTGGWIPDGADSVVMLEDANIVGEFVEIYSPCATGENVLQIGDDVRQGGLVISKGKEIRAQEIGMLNALGIQEIEVARKPRVLIIPTGNELVEPWQVPENGKIREINSFIVTFLIKNYCEVAERHPVVRDDQKVLFEVIKSVFAAYDLLLLSGGSSKGAGDFAVRAIEEFEDSEVLFHGVRVSPGKPTFFAKIKEKPIIGLPGHPVSCFVSNYLFVLPLVKYLQGALEFVPSPSGFIKAGTDIPSKAGREEWVRVIKVNSNITPLFSESAILSSLVNASGLIRIPENKEGIHKGEEVEFYEL